MHDKGFINTTIAIIVVVLAGGFVYWSATRTPDAPMTYSSQEECETTTGMQCAFIMCDVVPAGQTFEEACGKGFQKGWIPLNEPLSPPAGGPQPQNLTSPTETWKMYSNQDFKIGFQYPSSLTLIELPVQQVGFHPSAFNARLESTRGNVVLFSKLPLIDPPGGITSGTFEGLRNYLISTCLSFCTVVDTREIVTNHGVRGAIIDQRDQNHKGYNGEVWRRRIAFYETRGTLSSFEQVFIETPNEAELISLESIAKTFRFLSL